MSDAPGKIPGLNPETGQRALAVQVEAEKFLLNADEVTVAAAVQRAFKNSQQSQGGDLLEQARQAIRVGKDPDAVKAKLKELGGDPSKL